jgi:hypothetical protein
LTPEPIRQLHDWVVDQLAGSQVPSEREVYEQFARPFIGLIKIDCGPTVARLVEERLGVDAEPRSVREQARQLGVTRARIYQLLDDVGRVMSVRWTEGKSNLDRLTAHYSSLEQRQGELRLFFGLCELGFPEKQSVTTAVEAHAGLEERHDTDLVVPAGGPATSH